MQTQQRAAYVICMRKLNQLRGQWHLAIGLMLTDAKRGNNVLCFGDRLHVESILVAIQVKFS